ncbi:MAG: hypothetical protein J6A89_02735 [Clostridia bacterium]|nr:hypothetical protein [Clostridia bacterium]
MLIRYINKIPSKIEYFDMVRTEYENVEVSELSTELDSTITAVCAYNGDRLVGMGRVKKDDNLLCIQDLIVKLEPYKEEIQNNIILNLIKQINQIKMYNITVRDCLDMTNFNIEKKSNENNIEESDKQIVGA